MDAVLLVVVVGLLGSALWFLLQFAAWSLVIRTESQARNLAPRLRVFALFAVLFVAAMNLLICLRDGSVTFLGVFGAALALGWVFVVTLFAVKMVGVRKRRRNEN